MCRIAGSKKWHAKPLHFRNIWSNGTETDTLCSISFHFCWAPVVFLEHQERRSRDRGYSHIQSMLQVSASISSLSRFLPCPSQGAAHHSDPGAGHREGQRLPLVRATDLLPKYPKFFSSLSSWCTI